MPVKSFEQVQSEEAARKQQLATQAQQRKQEIDAIAQMSKQRAGEQAAQNREREAFAQRVEAWHANPTPLDRSAIPGWDGYYQAKRAEEIAAAEEAERQRLAALTPREVWLNTLTSADRAHVLRYEQINHTPWPYVPV